MYEPQLNILMLEYKYNKDPDTKKEILRLAKEHDFYNHLYLGIRIIKNDLGQLDIKI